MSISLTPGLNWEAVREEVTGHLGELLRKNTVNPPGNENLVARYLKETVEREDLDAQILESALNRGNFVTRFCNASTGS